MAQVAEAAIALGPSVYHGFKHEYDELKKDPETNRLKRIGHGFKYFGKGFTDSLFGSDDRAPTSNVSNTGSNMTQQNHWG